MFLLKILWTSKHCQSKSKTSVNRRWNQGLAAYVIRNLDRFQVFIRYSFFQLRLTSPWRHVKMYVTELLHLYTLERSFSRSTSSSKLLTRQWKFPPRHEVHTSHRHADRISNKKSLPKEEKLLRSRLKRKKYQKCSHKNNFDTVIIILYDSNHYSRKLRITKALCTRTISNVINISIGGRQEWLTCVLNY